MRIQVISIRFPFELYQWFKVRAQNNERSFNREVIAILKQVKLQEQEGDNKPVSIL